MSPARLALYYSLAVWQIHGSHALEILHMIFNKVLDVEGEGGNVSSRIQNHQNGDQW